MYRAVTHDIEVSVVPHFLSDRSAPEESRFVWAYEVEITNHRSEPVQLRSRFWRIVDGRGKVEEVRGPGVVGEQPVIAPGGTHRYASGCPLRTPSGIMSGSYFIERPSGETLEVKIPAFSLDSPYARRSVN
jgi:ApaG protein